MTEQIPTPTPEQVQHWINHLNGDAWRRTHTTDDFLLATRAAQWGADQELKACCEFLEARHASFVSRDLRAARRPQPKSLAEEALEALKIEDDAWPVKSSEKAKRFAVIRRALERLQELEDNH